MSLPTEYNAPAPVVIDDQSQSPEAMIDVWGIIWRRKWIIGLVMVLSLTAGYFKLISTPPTYESTSKLLIEERRSVSVMDEVMSQTVGLTADEKHAMLITSPRIAQLAVELGQLDKLPSFANSQVSPVDVIVDGIAANVADYNTHVYNLAYRGSHPEDTRKVLTAVVAAYREFLKSTNTSEAQRVRDMLTDLHSSYMSKLTQLEEKIKESVKNNKLNYQDGTGTNKFETMRASLQAELEKTIVEQTTVAAEVESLRKGLADPQNRRAIELLVSELVSNQDSQAIQRRTTAEQMLVPLLLKEQELRQRYEVDHPKVRAVARQIAIARDVIQRLTSSSSPTGTEAERNAIASEIEATAEEQRDLVEEYLASRNHQLSQLNERRARLEKLTNEAESEAKNLALIQLEEANMRQEQARLQKMFDVLATQLENSNALDDAAGYRFEEMSFPEQGYKVAPSPIKYLGMAGVLGVMLGFGLGYLVEIADQGFRNVEEVQRALRAPVIGHVPLMDLSSATTLPGSSIAPVMCAVHRPKSPLAESYRSVRTALYFSTRGKGHQVIQVTSPVPGDGKSTLAANLAVTIAHSGKSCLLLDCDFRRPTLQKVFGGLDMSVGLASVVDGQADPDEAMRRIREVPNLTVMPCGPRPENPSELLSSPSFENVLELLRERFDFVIVDTPPLFAVTDPLAVGARVDGVIMTFRIDKRAKPMAVRAREMLSEQGVELIGIVVNGVSPAKGSAGYRYSYGKGYGYGYGYGYTNDEAQKKITAYFEEDKTPVGSG